MYHEDIFYLEGEDGEDLKMGRLKSDIRRKDRFHAFLRFLKILLDRTVKILNKQMLSEGLSNGLKFRTDSKSLKIFKN